MFSNHSKGLILIILFGLLWTLKPTYSQHIDRKITALEWGAKDNIAIAFDQYVEVYERSGQIKATLVVEGSIRGMQWNPEGDKLAYTDGFGTLMVWDMYNSAILSRWIDGMYSSDVIWNADGTKLAMAATNAIGSVEFDRINILDATTLTTLKVIEIDYYDFYLGAIAWNPLDEKQIVFPINDRVSFWDIESGLEVSSLSVGENTPLRTDEFGEKISIYARMPKWSMDKQTLAVADSYGNLWFWNTSTWEVYKSEFSGREDYEWGIDGKLAAVFYDSIKIFETQSEKTLIEITIEDFPNNYSLAWSPDGTQLAYGGASGELHIIDIPTLETTPEPP